MMNQPVREDYELASERQVEASTESWNTDLKFRKQAKERDLHFGKILKDGNLYWLWYLGDGQERKYIKKNRLTWKKIKFKGWSSLYLICTVRFLFFNKYLPAIPLLSKYPKRMKMGSPRELHSHIHGSITHTSQDMETT